MKFTKMQGLGNDYVYVDCTNMTIENENDIAIKVSNRHFGIGSDGLILIKKSNECDFKMDMYNADGSISEMCGNGIRCVGKFVYDKGLTDKTYITIETLAGIKKLWLTIENNEVTQVKVMMGEPILESKLIPIDSSDDTYINKNITILENEYKITCVSMGNPHAVTFIEDVDNLTIEKIGSAFEQNSFFPNRVNTEFVQIISKEYVKMRVWERGSGETYACGTGACAVLVACVLNNLTNNSITIELLGGTLLVEWDKESNQVYMTGPAKIAFEGEINLTTI